MREAHGLPQTSQVHIIIPLAATGSFLAFRLATRAAVRLSSKADMAFEQHCLQTLLSRSAVRNTEGARSHARRLILRLSLTGPPCSWHPLASCPKKACFGILANTIKSISVSAAPMATSVVYEEHTQCRLVSNICWLINQSRHCKIIIMELLCIAKYMQHAPQNIH